MSSRNSSLYVFIAFFINQGIRIFCNDIDSCVEGPDGETCEEAVIVRKTQVSGINNKKKYLAPMVFEYADERETFLAYVMPDISEFYLDDGTNVTRTLKQPVSKYMGIKVVNLGSETLELYWHPGDDEEGLLLSEIAPFQAYGASSFPGHDLYLAITKDEDDYEIVKWIEVEMDQGLYYYDPYEDMEDELEEKGETFDINDHLNEEDLNLYLLQKQNLAFAEQYKEFTGRDWFSLYPLKTEIYHDMWDADYFGQQHWVATTETHFAMLPPEEEMKSALNRVSTPLDDEEPRLLASYRSTSVGPDLSQTMYLNLTLTVLSVAPRIFEIDNFLSDVEIDHILEIATEDDEEDNVSWLVREKSVISDSIYRRAADLLQIDEAFLRQRRDDEYPQWSSSTSAAEAMRIMHFLQDDKGTIPGPDAGAVDAGLTYQNDRFATLLVYLNDEMIGGQTAFPRWKNAVTTQGLNIMPKKGKAILFYSYLPDGNFDELSIRSGRPIIEGEKLVMNLWVWDPTVEFEEA